MSNASNEYRAPLTEGQLRAPRPEREQRDTVESARLKPLRRRANDITNAIGLTPIKGRSGPRIAY